jgi:ketosteroid isomerase-like protein
MKRLAVLVFVLSIAITAVAQKSGKAPARTTGSGAPDKAYAQKIWDGWAAMDPANQAQYYAQGPHAFFDITPLKYASWDEYQEGVAKVLSGFKAAKFTVNDDLQVHKCGDAYWVTSTVASDLTEKSGKRDMSQFRWTAIFEKHDGKWLIVQEHVSQPIS